MSRATLWRCAECGSGWACDRLRGFVDGLQIGEETMVSTYGKRRSAPMIASVDPSGLLRPLGMGYILFRCVNYIDTTLSCQANR